MTNKFPKYLKATDLDGNTIALLVVEAKDRTTVIEHNGALGRMSFRTVPTANDADVGGLIVEAGTDEYDAILYDQWKFDISDAVLFAKAVAEEEGEHDAEDTDVSGSDATAGSAGGEQAEVGTGFSSGDGAAITSDEAGVAGNGDDSNDGTASAAGTDEKAYGDESAPAPDGSGEDDGVKDETAESQK